LIGLIAKHFNTRGLTVNFTNNKERMLNSLRSSPQAPLRKSLFVRQMRAQKPLSNCSHREFRAATKHFQSVSFLAYPLRGGVRKDQQRGSVNLWRGSITSSTVADRTGQLRAPFPHEPAVQAPWRTTWSATPRLRCWLKRR